MKKSILILDTNAFIKCADIEKMKDEYDIYTTENVLWEIRDKKAQQKYESLTFEIEEMEPSETAKKFVRSFAKKTGDFSSLSETDLDIIALGYTMAENYKLLDQIRKEPPDMMKFMPEIAYQEQFEEEEEKSKAPQLDEDGFATVVKKGKNKNSSQQEKGNLQIQKIQEFIEIKQQSQDKNEVSHEQQNNEEKELNDDNLQVDDESSEEDDDNGKGWINPTNVTKYLNCSTEPVKEQKFVISIMTSDYAMQNVIIQMGINLLSFDGMVIMRAKRFVLECYACKRICKNPTKKFCPTCGNATMTKLSCSINSDGTIQFYRKKNFKINTRGAIYSIPKLEGGRKNNDILLREDEFFMYGRDIKARELEKQKEKQFDKVMLDFNNGLGFDKTSAKKQQFEIGYGRINPNDQYAFKKKSQKK